MRLTVALQHAKFFWWGKGWGSKPHKDRSILAYKKQWENKRRQPLEVLEQKLPEDAVPIDPNAFVKEQFNREFHSQEKFVLPWPYSKRYLRESPDDPNYHEKGAYVYHRRKPLVEPLNLPLYFTNSVLESGIPTRIEEIRKNANIDDGFVEYADRRIKWCLENDAALRKLPLDREFPYLDQRPPRVWGVTKPRKENHLLHTLFDISNTWVAKNQRDPNVITQRVSYPLCNVPLTRDGQFIVLEIECDFFTLVSTFKPDYQKELAPFDPNSHTNTSKRNLQSIHPLSWEVGFKDSNFYNTDYSFELPKNTSVQTIFISNSEKRKLNDIDYQGRGVMSCYAFAVKQAKLKYKTDEIENITLEKPICVQCVYTNPLNFNVGYVLFQLNTLKWNDKSIRNQVWLSEPLSATNDSKELIADLVSIQTTLEMAHSQN